MLRAVAAALYLLYGARRFFVHHLVFSLHFFAWLLLLLVFVSLLSICRMLLFFIYWRLD
ncbi:MAG TPA: hypothetical protein VMN60_09600 [Longimicrobiales bacterium]|nr:hypothetical protein [Longimicrobiales bacterium]